MDDMERYGDYNECDEPPKRSPALKAIKIVALVICFSVVGLILMRLVLFNYTPAEVSRLYFTESLTEYYNKTGGRIGAKTQNLRAPYDDAKDGNFFCDNLIVIPEIGELQITLRHNISLLDKIRRDYSLEELSEDDVIFSFRICRNGGAEDGSAVEVGKLSATLRESFLIYRYYKLVFDGIDFETGGEDGLPISWLRLEIFIQGVEMEKPYMVAIYENNEVYSKFQDYRLSGEEVPK